MKKSTWITLTVFVLICAVVLWASVAMNQSLAASRAARAAATPAPGLAYKEVALNHVNNLVEAFGQLGPLLKEARVGESDWTMQVGMWVAQARAAHELLNTMQPPTDMISIHAQLTSATAKCYAATQALTTGIDNDDPTMLQASLTFLDECYTALTPAVAALKGN